MSTTPEEQLRDALSALRMISTGLLFNPIAHAAAAAARIGGAGVVPDAAADVRNDVFDEVVAALHEEGEALTPDNEKRPGLFRASQIVRNLKGRS